MPFDIDQVLILPTGPGYSAGQVIDRLPTAGKVDATSAAHDIHQSNFDYLDHYEQDAEVFDYFELQEDQATLHENTRLHETILRELPAGTKTVLDIGCGNAWVAEILTARGITVVSFDIASANLRKALAKVPGGGHFAVRGDVLALPFRDDSFDAIISSEVIEHVPHLKGYLANIIRVVKRGGRAIITTPYNEKIQYSLCIHCNRPTPLHAHIHSFTETSLDQILYAHPEVGLTTFTLSNKALLYLQTHKVLKYFPFGLWRGTDRLANAVLNRPGRLIYRLDKQG